MFDDIPGQLQAADRRRRGGRLALHAGRQERAPSAGAADARPRRALHHARGEGRPRQPARRRVPRHRVDQGEDPERARSTSRSKLPSMYHQFKQLADLDITKEPMEVGPTTHYIMGGVRVDGDTQMSTRARPVRRGRVRRRASTARTGSAATRSRTCSCSASAPASTRRSSRKAERGRRDRRRAGRRGRDDAALEPFERGAARREAVPGAARAAGDDAGPGRHRAHAKTRWSRRSTSIGKLQGARREGRRRPATANTTPAGTRRSICGNLLDGLGGHHARGARAQGKPRRPFPRRLSRTRIAECGKFNIVVASGADGAMQVSTRADSADAGRAEAGHRGDEVDGDQATFRIWRGDADGGGKFEDYTDRGVRGHGRARRRPPDPGRAGPRPRRAAGTARPASAARARPRSTACRS